MSVCVKVASVERDVVDWETRADEEFVFLVLAAAITLEGCGLIWLFG